MDSSQDIVCNCKNTCTRVSKRGSCPCRAAGKLCTSMCSCGWMVPCINKPKSKPPKPKMIDVDLSDFADREILSMARDHMDGDTDHNPLLSKPNPKRKRKAAADTRVRRRLEVNQVQNDTSEELGSAPTRLTTCCPPSSPKGPATHHQAVKEFAASLDVTELQTIVTELLLRDQGAFEDYRLGYRPCDDPPRQPQPDDLPRWCRCGNCRPMPSAQEDKCCWQTCSSQCVVDGPNFYTVISPAVLDIAMAHYNSMTKNETTQHTDTKHTDNLHCKGLDA